MTELLLTLVLLPPLLASAAIAANLLTGETHLSWRQVQRIAVASLTISAAAALVLFLNVLADPTPREVTAYTWFTAGNLSVEVGFLVDSLSALMTLMVAGFSVLIAIFSINYMHKDPGFSRYFAAMTLFVFAMLLLVLGNNFILLFVGWESVGLCSYLLIGHYYNRKSAASAGTKAFVMNRVGDAGFLAGIFLIILNFGTVKYTEVFARLAEIDTATATAIALCLLAGAIGKSAQFPLGTWLARAMEGPTPSSALIHAATMVTAGIYMIVRAHELFDMAPAAQAAVTIVGALTAIYGGLHGMTNTDIKGILASSTVTQLGLMFVACGLGAYPVAVFHLVAHAFLKTFLFLTAPSILHYFHTFPDPRASDKITAPVPIMFWFILIGSIGLIGSAFGITTFGDGAGLQPSYYLLAGMLLMAAFVTLRHAMSATMRIFGDHGHDHSHDHDHHDHDHKQGHASIALLLVPVALIAIGVLLALTIGLLPGGVPSTWFHQILEPVVTISPLGDSGSILSWAVVLVLGALLLSAWAASIHTERFAPELPGTGLLNTRTLYVAAQRRFWLDDLYHKVIVGRSVRLGKRLEAIDRDVIDRVTGTQADPLRSADADSDWEQGFLAARAAGLDDVLGQGSDERAGLLARLHELNARSTDEAVTLDSTPKAAIDQGAGLFGGTVSVAGRISSWVERTIFDRLHGGVARTGGNLGEAFYQIEDFLGRPAVLVATCIVVVVGVLLGMIL